MAEAVEAMTLTGAADTDKYQTQASETGEAQEQPSVPGQASFQPPLDRDDGWGTEQDDFLRENNSFFAGMMDFASKHACMHAYIHTNGTS